MMTDTSSVVLDGWLTKSSRNKQPWKSGWKKLWFVLRSTGQIPGQFLLEYYTNDDCKKLKGSIDLDQLEQVDAGLSLRFGSGNRSHKHIFDIRTKDKEYYFATPSEEDMDRWVRSICSVCHLKLASSPDEAVPITGPVASTVIHHREDAPAVIHHHQDASVVIHHQKDSSTSSCESSGPYIPISECHSGNPSDMRASESSHEARSASTATGNASVNKNVILADELYDFPKSSNASKNDDSTVKSIHTSIDEAGNNNWPTFSTNKDDIIRASVRSCSALDSSKSNSTLTRDSRNSQSFHSASRLRGASSITDEESSLYTNGNYNGEQVNEGTSLLPGKVPPPRPPKPATLRRSKSKSQSSCSLVNNNEVIDDLQQLQSVPQAPVVTVSQVDESYDMPKSCTSNKDTFIHLNQVVPPSMPTVYVRGKLSNLLGETSPLTSGTRLPEVTPPVDLYDFPRAVEATVVTSSNLGKSEGVIDLNATVPIPTLLKKDIGGKHSYSNAASGFISTKESVFNYDYKPSLPVASDDQTCTLSPYGDLSHSSSLPEKSPRTPNSAFSPCNDFTPPAVDRKLKPRRNRGSDSDTIASPTAPHPFPLSPPPATARKSNFPSSTLPSSKSFKNKNGQHSYDSIPRSCNTLGHRGSSTIGCHSRDHSISEDDSQVTGRCDEIKVHLAREQKQILERPELQYLDLDLNDSGNSSPRTPNSIPSECSHQVSSSSINPKHAVICNVKERSPSGTTVASNVIPSTISKSTVYKTVDFVKTDALNKLRQNLDQGNT